MTLRIRLPYLTFAALLAAAGLFLLFSLSWEKRIYEEQNRQIDPSTGTWRPTYDWQAADRAIQLNDHLRVAILWVVVAHGLVNSLYAAAVTRGWRGILLGLVFACLSAFLALILLLGNIAGATMIG
ncbi:MAG TPA: hypothetical protein VFI08_01390 [Spirochaetia bacterium]|nr:hypothetical protein [Spirochaetia bacterium]